jgi:hypothetical protein
MSLKNYNMKELFLKNMSDIDITLTKYIEEDELEILNDDFLNEYYALKSALSCAILFSNYASNSNPQNMLEFMSGSGVLFDSVTLLSLCNTRDDIDYFKFIIDEILNCYLSMKNMSFMGKNISVLSINPFTYKKFKEISNMPYDSEIDISHISLDKKDKIVTILTKALNILNDVKIK